MDVRPLVAKQVELWEVARGVDVLADLVQVVQLHDTLSCMVCVWLQVVVSMTWLSHQLAHCLMGLWPRVGTSSKLGLAAPAERERMKGF